jgi:hypothetical protein
MSQFSSLVFSRQALLESGIKAPKTHEDAIKADCKHLTTCGYEPITYSLYEQGDGWLAILTVGSRSYPILIKDWLSLVNCLGLLSRLVSGKLLDTSNVFLSLMNDAQQGKSKTKSLTNG